VLAVSPEVLNFDTIETVQEISISNVGGGLLTVLAVESATKDGASWLTATPVGVANGTVSVPTVRVSVNRSALTPGDFRGTVTIRSDGGEVSVEIVMTVLFGLPPPADIDVFVRARRADTGTVVQSIVVNPTSALTWTFPTLPVGRYVFEASSDFDGDGILFEDGDYGGTYPLLGDPIEVVVEAATPVTGIEFSVTLRRILGASAP
jgi:hypothetical protein